MKRVFKVFVILLLLVSFDCLGSGILLGKNSHQKKNRQEGCIKLESIYFNHDPNCSDCDAINIVNRYNDPVNGPVHLPEWDNGESYPAAYIMNKFVTVKVIFSADPEIKTARIRALSLSGEFGDLGEELVSFDENGVSLPIPFSIPGKTPGEIKTFYQEWMWLCVEMDGNLPDKEYIDISRNKVYIVLDDPQPPPWDKDSHPWSEALEYACKWAEGARTPVEAAGKITKALYNDVGCFYEGCHAYYTLNPLDYMPFFLKKFINNFQSTFGVGEVNCVDMAKALITFSNSVGCGLTYTRKLRDIRKYLNCVKLVGQKKCCVLFFRYHSGCKINDRIFDATLKTYTSNGHEEWVINQEEEQYRRRIIRNYQKTSALRTENLNSVNIKISSDEVEVFLILQKILFQGIITILDNIYKTKVIAGITMDNGLFKEIDIDLTNYNYCQYYSTKKNIDGSYSAIVRKLWRNGNDILDLTMKVAPDNKISKAESILSDITNEYLAHFFNNFSGILNQISSSKKKSQNSNEPCKLHNVKIEVKVTGSLKNYLSKIEYLLNKKLNDQEVKDDYARLDGIPEVKDFLYEEKWINGQKNIFLTLKVGNQGYWVPVWRVYKGRVERVEGDRYIYFDHKPGKNHVKAFVVNDRGLILETKTLDIEFDH